MSKKITQLPAVTTAADASLLPVVVGGATSQISKANLLKEITTWMSSINSLLASDDTTLDELQEIVTFIKANKTTLDALAIPNIAGLQAALNAKALAVHGHTAADVSDFDDEVAANTNVASNTAHRANTSNPHGVSKAQIGLTNVINTLQLVAADVEDVLTSSSASKPLSANQGRVLKGLIDNINTLLSSDENTLDSLQEVVDFIETNKSTLDALSIASIAGLQNALDSKAADANVVHKSGDETIAGKKTFTGQPYFSNNYIKLDKDFGFVLDAYNVGGRNKIWTITEQYPNYGISYYEGSPDDVRIHISNNPAAPDWKIDGNGDGFYRRDLSVARNLGVVGNITIADDAFDDADWNGNLTVPTKNALRDKFATVQSAIDSKAAASHVSESNNPHSVTKDQVGLSNVIDALQLVAADVNDTLTSSDAAKPLSANQGRILKGLIDNINTLLSSDETNLDTLQEIVDFIELNKSTLDALSIGSISGLQAALDGKADSVHSHAIGDTSGLQAALDAKAAAAHSHSNASTGAAGFMSAADKSKLDDVEADATADQTATEIETAYNSRVSVVSQAEAEAGDATTVRRWTAQRIKQAIAALAGGGGGVYDYIEVAQATPQNFGGSNLTETVAAWDAAVSDAGTGNFSHSTTVNNERITVNADGRYRVQATLSRTQGGSARTSYQVFLRKNGSDVFKGISINYSRGSAYGDASNNFDTEIDLVDGDYIEIVNKIGDTDGTYTSNSIPARLQFIMTKLS